MTMRRLPEKQLYKQKCLELLKGALDIRNRRTLEGIRSKQAAKQTLSQEKKALLRIVYILLSTKNLIEKLLKIRKPLFLKNNCVIT